MGAGKRRVHVKGACLGEDMILSHNSFRDLVPAIALTFVVQAAAIEKRTLLELLSSVTARANGQSVPTPAGLSTCSSNCPGTHFGALPAL